MGSDADLLLESLMKWLHTFPVTAARDTIENVCDGVAMAQVRHEDISSNVSL